MSERVERVTSQQDTEEFWLDLGRPEDNDNIEYISRFDSVERMHAVQQDLKADELPDEFKFEGGLDG